MNKQKKNRLLNATDNAPFPGQGIPPPLQVVLGLVHTISAGVTHMAVRHF